MPHCSQCFGRVSRLELDADGRCRACSDYVDHDDDDDFEEQPTRGNMRILSCTEKPPLNPIGRGDKFRANGTQLHYGVELECESSGNIHASVMAEKVWPYLKDFAIIKEDGSLCNGFEICTSPMSLPMHYEKWQDFFSNRPQGLRSWSGHACGMHVHCTRAALSDMQLAKALLFMNKPANKEMITIIAGRDSSFARFRPDKTKITKGILAAGAKYEAINLCPTKTIEFRIFRGTLNKQRFFSNLQFCAALLHFARPCNTTVTEAASKEKFLEFVGDERKRFPDLHDLLVRKEVFNDSE